MQILQPRLLNCWKMETLGELGEMMLSLMKVRERERGGEGMRVGEREGGRRGEGERDCQICKSASYM